MKTFSVTTFLLVAAVSTAPQQNPGEAIILHYENDNNGVDGYSYLVETSDGQFKSEQGTLENIGTENEVLTVRGQYSYSGPDGILYTVSYIADENGFQPEGPHVFKTL